jgi:hypothetical protein
MGCNILSREIPALQVGTTVKLYNKDDRITHQIASIEVVDPPRQFALRWQPDPHYSAMTLVRIFMLEQKTAVHE